MESKSMRVCFGCTHRMMQHDANLANVRKYLAFFKWDLPPADSSGLTWLEVLTSFEILGYRLEQPIKA